jgi:hypothetical protein
MSSNNTKLFVLHELAIDWAGTGVNKGINAGKYSRLPSKLFVACTAAERGPANNLKVQPFLLQNHASSILGRNLSPCDSNLNFPRATNRHPDHTQNHSPILNSATQIGTMLLSDPANSAVDLASELQKVENSVEARMCPHIFIAFRDSICSQDIPADRRACDLAKAINSAVYLPMVKLDDDLDDEEYYDGSADVDDGDSATSPPTSLWKLWLIMVDVVRLVPVENEWHDILVKALGHLAADFPPVPMHPRDFRGHVWADFPFLSWYIRDMWADPTLLSPDNIELSEGWRRLNSFTARLCASNAVDWLTYPIWQLRDALEQPLFESFDGLRLTPRAAETVFWNATEWIFHFGPALALRMRDLSDRGHPDDVVFSTGPLCQGCGTISQWGADRWCFWILRLEALLLPATMDELGLGDDMAKRLRQALAILNDVGAEAFGVVSIPPMEWDAAGEVIQVFDGRTSTADDAELPKVPEDETKPAGDENTVLSKDSEADKPIADGEKRGVTEVANSEEAGPRPQKKKEIGKVLKNFMNCAVM